MSTNNKNQYEGVQLIKRDNDQHIQTDRLIEGFCSFPSMELSKLYDDIIETNKINITKEAYDQNITHHLDLQTWLLSTYTLDSPTSVFNNTLYDKINSSLTKYYFDTYSLRIETKILEIIPQLKDALTNQNIDLALDLALDLIDNFAPIDDEHIKIPNDTLDNFDIIEVDYSLSALITHEIAFIPFPKLLSWAVPTHEKIKYIKDYVGGKIIVEIGAGNGLWSGLLRSVGCTIYPIDNFSTHGFTETKCLVPVENISISSAFDKYTLLILI